MAPREAPRVLVVDDRAELAEMLAEDLRDRGYAATALTSGRDAIRWLDRERVDALITDVGMPEITGIDLLRASMARDPTRPVILMTAYSSLASAVEATATEAYHYLTKPFRLDYLSVLVGRALARR